MAHTGTGDICYHQGCNYDSFLGGEKGEETAKPEGPRQGWGSWGGGMSSKPPPHQLGVWRSAVSSSSGIRGDPGRSPAKIDLGTFQPCRRQLMKAIFVKNESLKRDAC